MSQLFSTIGLIGKPHYNGAHHTFNQLYLWLIEQGLQVIAERSTANTLNIKALEAMEIAELGKTVDLAIAVGGDGNMLWVARTLAEFDTAVIGINKGNLGFLTDISPDQFKQPLTQVLSGNYTTEYRFLLNIKLMRNKQVIANNNAVNEAILHAAKPIHMLEFEVYIDDDFVLTQKADGLIVATPTGSTAYALSGGGPIITPNLSVIYLAPMFPHTLTSRPILINADAQVKLRLSYNNSTPATISCDSHINLPVAQQDEIIITKHCRRLRLLHPKGYNYFNILRNKLSWSSRLA